MALNTELVGLLRTVLPDWDTPQRYSDERLSQVLILATNTVTIDGGFTGYTTNLTALTITPDPMLDTNVTNLILLKANCLIDTWSTRDAARRSGLSFQEFSSKVDTRGVAAAWLKLLEIGPCKAYDEALFDYTFGSGSAGIAILTPFRTAYSDWYDGCRR